MSAIDWRIRGIEFAACNCDWGCPCQFNALPTKGHCTGGLAMRIDEGWFGETRLDGVVWGLTGEWPGPIHHGGGKLLIYVDDRASQAQQDAIIELGLGKHSPPGTFLQIFNLMAPTKLNPVVARIDYECDPKSRTARLRVPGVLELDGEPIRNPITGAVHEARVDLPTGMEFRSAEFASCRSQSTMMPALNVPAGHAHFAAIHWGPTGILD